MVQRTDHNTPKAEAHSDMKLRQPPQHPASTGDGQAVPLEVFYVVRTTGQVVGKRNHSICPPLYETPHQAQMELTHLREEDCANGSYSVWKATTYIEPADWLYDVVVADGSIIQARDRHWGRGSRAAFPS